MSSKSTTKYGPDGRITRYATLSVESTGFHPEESRNVAIGTGVYDSVGGDCSLEVFTLGDTMGYEDVLIREAYGWINTYRPEALVTYNGSQFDLDFLAGRLESMNSDDLPTLDCADRHIDLFFSPNRRAKSTDRKWFTLAESLAECGLAVPVTEWRGKELTDARFDEELAPYYVEKVRNRNSKRMSQCEEAIRDYVLADIEANIALYEMEMGRTYAPLHLSSID